MSTSFGGSVAPIFLRLVLGVTFVWAGAGKIFVEREFTGEAADQIAAWSRGTSTTTQGAPKVEAPNVEKPSEKPSEKSSDGPQGSGADVPSNAQIPPVNPPSAGAPDPATSVVVQDVAPVRARNLMGIALMIKNASVPVTRADGTTGIALVPAKAAEGQMPMYLAWAAAITELAAGVLVLIGLFTRLCALSLASVMAVAMWLTQIGPAVAAGGAVLGFLPPHAPFDIPAWQPLMWQFSLLGASLALLFTGAGFMSLDGMLFTRRTTVVVRRPAVEAAAP
jgi:uncharacterized membrane protein YphA (DoxX/SURF4 family)